MAVHTSYNSVLLFVARVCVVMNSFRKTHYQCERKCRYTHTHTDCMQCCRFSIQHTHTFIVHLHIVCARMGEDGGGFGVGLCEWQRQSRLHRKTKKFWCFEWESQRNSTDIMQIAMLFMAFLNYVERRARESPSPTSIPILGYSPNRIGCRKWIWTPIAMQFVILLNKWPGQSNYPECNWTKWTWHSYICNACVGLIFIECNLYWLRSCHTNSKRESDQRSAGAVLAPFHIITNREKREKKNKIKHTQTHS